MSIVSRTFTEVGNAIKDAFGHVVHGDDAGTYETKVLIVHPISVKISGRTTRKFNLGISFLNVNDRAIVKAVEPGSDAALEGIRAQDCLQVAILLGGNKKLERIRNNEERAIDFGLECEKSGRRTSFGDLKILFENCSLNNEQSGFVLFDSSEGHECSEENTPITRRIRTTTQEMVGRCSGLDSSFMTDLQSTSFSEAEYPVVLVFRHAHKRHVRSTPHVGMPYFRLDDECERAALIVRRLAPSAYSQADPDAWDEIMENTSKYFSPGKKQPKLDSNGLSERKKNDVEVETIRGMIQNALGLAFIRTSKVVLGVSFHFGSGIVISRLDNGTWSAPSAIGMYGAGLGVQFGLEVADYIFILQTEEALDHFRQGTNYTIGGNMGAAMGGVGREAYGAASVGTPQNHKAQDKRKVAPLVAYAKSQGLYFGVSLEGSKIFTREDINRRAYKVTAGKELNTDDILSGRVPAPRGAEDLYATLHSVEYAHEMINLPRPPRKLVEDISNDWSPVNSEHGAEKGGMRTECVSIPSDAAEEFAEFETSFTNFLSGGMSVQRISPRQEDGSRESLERRILWLMQPKVGSLQLGYLSRKVADGNDDQSGFSDVGHCITEQLSTDDRTVDSRSTINSESVRKSSVRRFQLSKRDSLQLVDVTTVKRISTNAGNPNDDEKEMRVIQITDKYENYLRFIANTVREAELLICGLKLVLDGQAAQMGSRRGNPTGIDAEGRVEPLGNEGSKSEAEDDGKNLGDNGLNSDYSSSENESRETRPHIPEGHDSWSQVPARSNLRMEASMSTTRAESPPQTTVSNPLSQFVEKSSAPKYSHGDQLIMDIASNVKIPLPLLLCRVLFLDATSPLMKRWELDRGDTNYSRTSWSFPPSSPRHANNGLPMNELLSNGSMESGHRTVLFDRLRNGRIIRLSDSHIVMMDDEERVSLSISERMPRRGFSTKVRITMLKETNSSTSISIFGDIVPIGKDLSNQGAVHRAFLLVVDELKARYGAEEQGLLVALTKIVAAFPPSSTNASPRKSQTGIQLNAKSQNDDSKITPNTKDSSGSEPYSNFINSNFNVDAAQTPRRGESKKNWFRPSTPSLGRHNDIQVDNSLEQSVQHWATSDFVEWSDMPMDESSSRSDMTIDVKPLPKLRLDLMPAPREEDEDESSAI